MDALTAIRTSKMRPAQVLIIAACFVVLTIDGFDVFVMGFLLPYLPDSMVSTDAQRGLILSIGIMGMGVGALLLAPLADRIGRKYLLVALTFVAAIGMLICASAPSFTVLAAGRVVTGLAVGAMTPALSLLVQEYSSAKRRTFALGLFGTAFPLGTLVSGIFAVSLMQMFGNDWRAMFYFGAILGALCFALAVFVIPESIDFLFVKNTARSRSRLERIVNRIGLQGIDVDARPALTPDATRTTLSALFSRDTIVRTVVVVVLYSVTLFGFYWVSTWAPQIVATEAGDPQAGAIAGTIFGLGGVLGSAAFALYCLKFNPFRVHGIALVLGAASFIVVWFFFSTPAIALPFIAIGGLLIFFGLTCFGASIVPLYPVQARSTVLGVQGFVSRVAGVLAPIVVGLLLTFLAPTTMFALVAIPLLLGSVGGFYLAMKLGRTGQLEIKTDAGALSVNPLAEPGYAELPPQRP